MKNLKIILSFLFLFQLCNVDFKAQESSSRYNLDFEQTHDIDELPENWNKWGSSDYLLNVDSSIAYSGKNSISISSSPNVSKKSFGIIVYQLQANYSAQNITLTGFMKTKNVQEGFTGIFMRIDGIEKMIAFDNMQNQNIHGTNDWKQYKITFPFSKEAKKIFVGGLLTGTGKAWFDKFEILLDDRDITQVVIEPKKAELDKEFDSGSDIVVEDLQEWQVDNLYKTGKVWGFLKYYHPEIAKGNFNWDYELLRIIPKIINKNEPEKINSILLDLVNKLGEITHNSTSLENENIKLNFDIDWIKRKNVFGENLSNSLIQVSNSNRIEEHYYISLAQNVGNPIFENENPYLSMKFDDDGLKLIGLFRYWNIIQYYFPYRHLIDDNWDTVLKEFIPKIIEADDELSYKLTLLELIGTIHDTHANIWQKDNILSNYWGLNSAPIKVKIIEGNVIVTEILDKPLRGELRIGDKILSINNESVENIISNTIKYCPASNLPTKYRDAARKLLRTNEDSLNVTISKNGIKSDITVKCLNYDSNLFRESNIASHKILDNNIGYIYPGSLAKGEIDTIMQTMSNTIGLIVDLRCYPSDFIVFSLGKYLMPEPTEFVKFTIGSLLKPGEFNFGPTLKVGKSNKDYYKNNVIILINETTQSQAEYTTMALRVAPKALVIGSTTAGADGNLSYIILPGNVKTAISGIGVYYPDGTETQRIGIIPDIEVNQTIDGIKDGRDTVLEKAIGIINQK